jgi:DNA-binding NtrC family response regulator
MRNSIGSEKALIVGGDRSILSDLGSALNSMGYEVEMTGDSQSAQKQVADCSYDVILLDSRLTSLSQLEKDEFVRRLIWKHPQARLFILKVDCALLNWLWKLSEQPVGPSVVM